MDRLAGRLKHYDWGSATALADLRGIAPSGRPEAELWFDAPHLPFLVKVLAVQRPLSLQVHPGAELAAAGHAAEEEAGRPAGDPTRSFRDGLAKPELVCAVTPFEVLCGFRPVEEALEVAADLDLPVDLVSVLGADGPTAWPGLVEGALSGRWDSAIDGLLDTCCRGADGDRAATARLVCDLAEEHPGDPALLLVPLLAHHRLEPGAALSVDTGVPHAHLSGMAVEVMPPGDNVARAGLTGKHVDAAGFVRALEPACRPSVPQESTSGPQGGPRRYDAPFGDPVVWMLAADEGQGEADREGAAMDVAGRSGPDLVLAMAGTTTVGGLDLSPGEAVAIPEEDGPYRLATDGLAYLVASS